MAQNGKNTFSGVKIQQKPGGNSNFSLDWGHNDTYDQTKGTKQEAPTNVIAKE